MKTNNKVALLLSGGPDSVTLLHDLKSQGLDVVTLTFDFGEKEGGNEKKYAQEIASKLGVENHHFDFSSPLKEVYKSPNPQFLRAGEIAMRREDGTIESSNVKPFGSTIALMLAGSWAASNEISDIYYAVHADDAIYTDNKSEYFELLSAVTEACEGKTRAVRFHVPYLGITKSDVVTKGTELNVDFKDTWSCAIGGEVHCGVCSPCTSRKSAFEQAGVVDPTAYLSDEKSHLALN